MIAEKVALVTGSIRGIGLGIAQKLARNYYVVVTNAEIESPSTEKEFKKIHEKSIFIKADISSAMERASLVDRIKDEFGRIDLLVNNAGVAPKARSDILDATEESFDRLMAINLKGPYFLTQLVANWMIDLKKENRDLQPQIINIASMSSYTSSPARGDYCISKAGVSMMTKLYADRLAEYDIPVFEIRPGIIETDMTSTVKDKYDKLIAEGLTPIKRWGKAEDVAKAVIAITKGLLSFSTGEVINVDGGFHLRRL